MTLTAFSRRKFISKFALRAAAVFGAGIFLVRCGDNKTKEAAHAEKQVGFCDDFSAVSENDLSLRKKFAYVKESPVADNRCENCNLFLPPKTDQKCGGCMLFKGPVYKSGYCTYWAPKV